MWLQKLDSSNSAGCIHYWKKLRRSIQNATSWLHSATSWLHFELNDATFLLRLLKKALMALPVLYLSTWDLTMTKSAILIEQGRRLDGVSAAGRLREPARLLQPIPRGRVFPLLGRLAVTVDAGYRLAREKP